MELSHELKAAAFKAFLILAPVVYALSWLGSVLADVIEKGAL